MSRRNKNSNGNYTGEYYKLNPMENTSDTYARALTKYSMNDSTLSRLDYSKIDIET